MDRTGQIWLGVLLEDEGDACLCVRTEPRVDNRGTTFGYSHHFVDLETGETFVKREDMVGHHELEGFAGMAGRRRLQ